MPTTQVTTRRARTPQAPLDVKAAMKAGERAPRTHRKAKEPSDTVFVKALQAAEGFHRKAFFKEIAVCLAFYFTHKGADIKAKKALRPIYERAGYACKDAKGEDYKTVQRRISAAAALYLKLEAEDIKVDDLTDGEEPVKAIDKIADDLERRGLDSIQKVLVFSEKAPARRAPAAPSAPVQPSPAPAPTVTLEGAQAGLPQGAEGEALAEMAATSAAREATGVPGPVAAMDRRTTDKLPQERILRTEHLFLAIPFETTPMELMQMAGQMMQFAQAMQAVAVPAAAAAA